MKNLSMIVMNLLIGSTCFGMELNKSQKKVIKEYPSWTIDHKIDLFVKISKNQSKILPKNLDDITEVIEIDPLLDKPGLKYINQLKIKKSDFSEDDSEKAFKIIEKNIHNAACTGQHSLFYRKLKDVNFIYDYFDSNFIFLKRIAIDLKKDCF